MSTAASWSCCHYEGMVGVSSAGHGRVEAATVDGAVDEEKSVVDGATLGGVAGVGVTELEVVSGVVGGETDGAGWTGDGNGTVGMDVLDGPLVPVLHHRPPVGPQGPLVATGHDFVTHEEPLTVVVVVEGGSVGVEFTDCDAVALRLVVEPVDGVVGGGHQRHRLTAHPASAHDSTMAVSISTVVPLWMRPCRSYSAMTARSPVRSRWVASGFPGVGEPVDRVELDGTVGVGEVGEHAAPSDGGELAGIAHHDDPPSVPVGEGGEVSEFGGGDGAGFVHDHRRSPPQVVRRFG